MSFHHSIKQNLTTRPLILVGAGGHCRSVIEAARSAGVEIAGILDRLDSGVSEVLGCPVVGCDDDIPRLAGDYDFVVTLGMVKDPQPRVRLHDLILSAGGRLATIIASSAVVSAYAGVGPGSVVLHQAVVNAGAKIGAGCIINTAAVVEHDCTVGDYTHISTGAIVNGGSSVGRGCMIGSHATVIQGVEIEDGVVVGAATLVLRDIKTPNVIYTNKLCQ